LAAATGGEEVSGRVSVSFMGGGMAAGVSS
jgi:hypothetical protein